MSNTIRLGVLALLLAVFAGCSSIQTSSKPHELILLPVSDAPVPRLLKQRVKLKVQGHQQSFLSVIRWNNSSIHGAILMPTGQTLLTYVYRPNHGLKVENRMMDRDIPVEMMLAQVQIAYWPKASLLHAYPPDEGWSLDDHAQYRALKYQGETVLKIIRTEQGLHLEQPQRHYQLDIETINTEESRDG